MSDTTLPLKPVALGGRAAWWALAVIGLTQALSMVDRQVLAILLPRIKADLHVGDAEMGLLYGSVFALFYAVFSLPLGRIADGWVRTRLLGLSILGWSIMCALGGFASGFGLLAVSRLGVGIGEASVQPAGMSLLSDRFPRELKGTFTSVMAAATALGLGGALWIGAGVAGAWEHAWPTGSAPLGLKGWQAAFIAAALPGPLLAIALFRMREPVRGAADGIVAPHDPHPVRAGWHTLGAILPGFAWIEFRRRHAGAGTWAVNIAGLIAIVVAMTLLARWTDSLRAVNPTALTIGGIALDGNDLQWLVTGFGSYVLLCWAQSLRLRDPPAFALLFTSPATVLTLLVASLQTVINYGIMAWSPSFIIRTYHLDPAAVGMQFGILIGGMGIIGPLIAGPISDRIARTLPGGRIVVTLVALTVSPVFAFLVYRAPTLGQFYGWFILYSLALTAWLPPIYATLLDLVLPRMRASVISLYLLGITIFGMGIGPYTVGLISDRKGGELGGAILSLYWLAPILVVLTVLLLRQLPRDEARLIERARAAGEPV